MNHAIVLDKIKLSHSLYLLRLRPESGFQFTAGQFVIVPLPRDPQAAADAKAPKGFYSIASAEQDTRELELLIEHRDGYVSNWMTTRRPSDQLSLEGPLGKFALSRKRRLQVFLGFKAGIAPLRSMILTQLQSGAMARVQLFLGEPDLLFDAQWRELALQYPRFSYHPCSDPAAALAAQEPERQHLDIYTAGFNSEIEPMLASLAAAGFDKSVIKTEKFG